MKHIIFKIVISLWKILPMKLFLSKQLKKSNFLILKLYKDLRFKGEMKVNFDNYSFNLNNPGYTTIENEIFWKGIKGWEKCSVSLWIDLSKEAHAILDIGANTGIFTLIAAAVNKNAEIYSFEPVKRTSLLLKKNLEINNFKNINFYEKAVSNVTGKSTFYDVTTESQYSSSLNEKMLEGISGTIQYEVDVISLDDLEELKNKKIDLIKLDVEMHEPESIQGMMNILKENLPVFIIEILNTEIGNRIENLIHEFDYCFYVINEEIGLKETHTLGDGINQNFLLFPNTRNKNLISKYLN
jgi:FkbM family methyltransferase